VFQGSGRQNLARGGTQEDDRINKWMKDIAPSKEIGQGFGHEQEK
jgi:uncharacterized protein YeaO (DUF488 family)